MSLGPELIFQTTVMNAKIRQNKKGIVAGNIKKLPTISPLTSNKKDR